MDKVVTPLSEEALRVCATQIIFAIEYFHECGIVHRYLMQRNVLICNAYSLKICNLENARRVTEQKCTSTGKAWILPPETRAWRFYKKSADWWAHGILLFEAFFESHPLFELDWEREEQVDSVLHKEVTFPSETKGGVEPSDEVKGLITGLLKKKRKSGSECWEPLKSCGSRGPNRSLLPVYTSDLYLQRGMSYP